MIVEKTYSVLNISKFNQNRFGRCHPTDNRPHLLKICIPDRSPYNCRTCSKVYIQNDRDWAQQSPI